VFLKHYVYGAVFQFRGPEPLDSTLAKVPNFGAHRAKPNSQSTTIAPMFTNKWQQHCVHSRNLGDDPADEPGWNADLSQKGGDVDSIQDTNISQTPTN
jgi:hypothetical protein